MDIQLKEAIHQLINKCEDIHQLTHIKLLLESERTTSSMVQEPTSQYGTPSIKQSKKEIAVLVDEENDIDFLKEIKNELDPNYVGDFDDLSPEDKAELLELINEPDDKDVITHEEYLKATARWRTN